MRIPEWVTYTYTPVIIATIGAILAIVAAAIQAHSGERTEKTRVGEFKTLLQRTNLALETNKKVFDNTAVQLEKLQEILKRNEELIETQSDIIASLTDTQHDITGGNSLCYLSITPIYNLGKAFVILNTLGDHHLRDVDIKIYDNTSKKTYEKNYGLIKVGQTNRVIMELPIPDHYKDNLFSVFVSSFSQTWSQQIVTRPTAKRAQLTFDTRYRIYKLEVSLVDD